MALETNLNEKRKEKGKRNLTCAAGGLEAHPSRPALSFPRCWAGRARFPVSFSRPRGPAQELLLPRALFLTSLTSGPRMSAALLLPHVITEPESSVISTESNPCYPGFLSKPRRLSSI
jgi:hypothetical protein